MKKFRRIMALLLAAVMVMSMGVVAFADETDPKITLPSAEGVGEGVKYDVYQILTGDYSSVTDEEGKTTTTLTNPKWGASTGKSGTAVTEEEMKTISELADGKPETASTLKSYCTGAAYKADQDPGAAVSVPSGYYLIEEKATEYKDGQEKSLYVVKVVGEDVTITRKAGTTESDKKVDDKNDSNPTAAADNGQKQTSSDYDIGDDVPYHVTAKISSQVGQYKKYHITLEDILESGKFDSINLDKTAVKLDGKAINDTDDYTVTTEWVKDPTKDGFTVKFTFVPKEGKDLSSLAGKVIAIDFTAKLGTGANIGAAGNKNTLKVSYSNNPNSTDDKDEGHTPDKVVITFTYKVVVTKVDQDNKPLDGAKFALYKVAADYVLPTTGDAKSKGDDAAEKKIQDYTAVISGDKNNVFTYKGLDDGRYVLVETTTPTGYNTLDPQVFDVKATHGGDDNTGITLDTLSGEKVSGEITLDRDTKDEDALKATIKNQKGSTLHETGGIGTTMFYIIGAIMVIGAGVVLISRRRMNVQ